MCLTSCDYGVGMCVALKHGLVIVSENTGVGGSFQLHMYLLVDGSLVRSVGSYGSGKGQFNFCGGGLCITPDGDGVLVAERYNRRVQVVKVGNGAWVRFIGVGVLRRPDFVDCSNDIASLCRRLTVIAYVCFHGVRDISYPSLGRLAVVRVSCIVPMGFDCWVAAAGWLSPTPATIDCVCSG